MRWWRGPALVAAITASVAAREVVAQLPSDVAVRTTVDSLAGAALSDGPVAGMVVEVVRGADTIVNRGYGLADIASRRPATDSTVFRIGSITKQFTASLIMQLVEQGKVALADSLTRFLPDYPVQGHDVRVFHLLTHTSGIKSYTSLGPRWSAHMGEAMPLDTLIALFKDEPFDFAPGARFLYDNSGYVLLGKIIEVVTGKPYATYLTESLLRPLGLHHTRYCPDTPRPPSDAMGYTPGANGLAPARPLSMTQPFAAGALCSTVGDLVRWTALLHSGKVVAPASFARMTAPVPLDNGDTSAYGFGLAVGNLDGHRWIGHGGGINGFVSQLVRYPDDDVTIAVLVNSEGGVADAVAENAARAALGIPILPPKDLAVPSAERQRLLGSYSSGGFTIRVVERDSLLAIQPTGQPEVRLLAQGGGVYLPKPAPDQEIRFVGNGGHPEAMTISVGGRVVWTGQRVATTGD